MAHSACDSGESRAWSDWAGRVALDVDWGLFGGPKGSSRTDSDGRFRIGLIAPGDSMLTATNPGGERKPVTLHTPFVRIHVVDADVSGLIIQLPIR